MKRVFIIIFFICCYSINNSPAQSNESRVTLILEKLFTRLRENHPDVKKIEINDSIRSIIDSYALSDSIFNHRFVNIRSLGQITSPDSLVKIITWNLVTDNAESSYFCYIVRREGRSEINHVFKLKGTYNSGEIRTEEGYSISDWYGALYYDIRPFILNNSTRYIILGINYGNPFITRKVIDILGFEGKAGITFGSKCFTDGKSISSRVVFEYSSTAVMSLRFEADNFIVFDHLSPFSPEQKDNRQFYGPDFSFDSYRFEKGLWRLNSDIDIKNR